MIQIGGVKGGAPRQPGQQGQFLPVKLRRLPAEVGPGGGRDAIGPVAEVDLVEVGLEDLVFAVMQFQA